MLVREAALIAELLARYEAEEVSPVLNIGSSTLHFRTEQQPHIEEMVIAPVEARGGRFIHADLKEGPGIDISADLLTDDGFARLKSAGPRFVLCANVLEHVTDPAAFARRCLDLVGTGGRVLFTVPRSYPYHRDPIDTMFRPTPDEVRALLDRPVTVEFSQAVSVGSYWPRLIREPMAAPWRLAHLPWLFKPYRQTFLLVRTGDSQTSE